MVARTKLLQQPFATIATTTLHQVIVAPVSGISADRGCTASRFHGNASGYCCSCRCDLHLLYGDSNAREPLSSMGWCSLRRRSLLSIRSAADHWQLGNPTRSQPSGDALLGQFHPVRVGNRYCLSVIRDQPYFVWAPCQNFLHGSYGEPFTNRQFADGRRRWLQMRETLSLQFFFRNECNTGPKCASLHFFPWKLFAVKPDNQTIIRAGFVTCIYRTAL